MLLIILVVLACLAYVVFEIATKPLLERDLAYLKERDERRYQEAKARMAA